MSNSCILITLKGIATILDAVAVQLEANGDKRDEKLDLIRCDLEGFREDLEEAQKEIWKADYSLLSRLQMDCKYFLGAGGGFGAEKHLLYGPVHTHIAKMRALFESLSVKPDWLSMEDIAEYEAKMLLVRVAGV